MAMPTIKLSFIMTMGFLRLNLLSTPNPEFLIIRLIYKNMVKYKLIDNVLINTNRGSVM
jgi:hypothetical protein